MDEIWKQLPDEPNKAFQAFCIYRELDIFGEGEEKQTLPNVAKQLGASLGTMKAYSTKYKWKERIAAYAEQRTETQLAVMDVGVAVYRQRVLDDEMIQTEVMNRIIMNELANLLKRQAAGDTVESMTLVRLTNSMENIARMRRRAAGMVTAFSRGQTEVDDEDMVYEIGGELGGG